LFEGTIKCWGKGSHDILRSFPSPCERIVKNKYTFLYAEKMKLLTQSFAKDLNWCHADNEDFTMTMFRDFASELKLDKSKIQRKNPRDDFIDFIASTSSTYKDKSLSQEGFSSDRFRLVLQVISISLKNTRSFMLRETQIELDEVLQRIALLKTEDREYTSTDAKTLAKLLEDRASIIVNLNKQSRLRAFGSLLSNQLDWLKK